MTTNINPTLIAAEYKKVISAFKKRFDVQNGNALGYRQNQDPNGILLIENKPKGIGDGTTTTGWCVSVSQAFLLDNVFQLFLQTRGAMAKLVSIDIKEQHYGITYNGFQNKWHTAVLVCDNGFNFIIDLTCRQFGNYFNEKDIWDFTTWEKTFRSPLDQHVITNFDGNELTNIKNGISNNDNKNIFINEEKINQIVYNLHDIVNITDEERRFIADFFLNKVKTINKKLLIGNVNNFDFEYIDKANNLLKTLEFEKGVENVYSVMEFSSKDSAKKWIEKFLTNDCILQQYMIMCESIEKSCELNGINRFEVNKESLKNKTYIVFEGVNVKGLNVEFLDARLSIPFGIKLLINPETDIFNGGNLLGVDAYKMTKKTNTIYIKFNN